MSTFKFSVVNAGQRNVNVKPALVATFLVEFSTFCGAEVSAQFWEEAFMLMCFMLWALAVIAIMARAAVIK